MLCAILYVEKQGGLAHFKEYLNDPINKFTTVKDTVYQNSVANMEEFLRNSSIDKYK